MCDCLCLPEPGQLESRVSKVADVQCVSVLVSTLFSAGVHRIRRVFRAIWTPFELLLLIQADCIARVMDFTLCLTQRSRMVDSKRMRMTSNFQWPLLTFILLYLMNQVNSQKKGESFRVEKNELIAMSLLFWLWSDLVSLLNSLGFFVVKIYFFVILFLCTFGSFKKVQKDRSKYSFPI